MRFFAHRNAYKHRGVLKPLRSQKYDLKKRRCHSVRVWPSHIIEKKMKLLSKQALKLWDYYGGSRAKAKSFWIDKAANPRCELEAFALAVAKNHFGDNFLGAEFWVQYRHGNMREDSGTGGLEFHFDKDEDLLTKRDVWKHPELGTVTYLKLSGSPHEEEYDSLPVRHHIGAPLVVFSTTSVDPCRLRPLGSERLLAMPQSAWVVVPSPGIHVAFDGSLLHGVPGELNPLLVSDIESSGCMVNKKRYEYQRLSMPVNVWTDHRPSGAVSLPDQFIESLDLYKASRNHSGYLSSDFSVTSPSSLLQVEATFKVLEEGTSQITTSTIQHEILTNENNWYTLKEHRPGDTGMLPLDCIRGVMTGSLKEKTAGVAIQYVKDCHPSVSVLRPIWLSNNIHV